MSRLEEILKAAEVEPKRAIFVSRSGAVDRHRKLAKWIGARLEARGYIVILQDAHFKHADFVLAMDRALASGARVLALVSQEYQRSQYCMKEATAALDDQMNSTGRLIVFQIDDSEPRGVLRNVDRVDFTAAWKTNDAQVAEQVLFQALEAPADLRATYLLPPAVSADQVVHPEVLMHDEAAFTGRDAELGRLAEELWNAGSVDVVRAGAALSGMPGVGKTTLARAYAWRNRDCYHGVWWLRAEMCETLVDDLIELGARFLSGLETWDDRDAAAREALMLVARPNNRPWLLVFDNAPGPSTVRSWRPEKNAHVIVTSRYPNWGAVSMPVDVFSPEAAVEFLCTTTLRHRDQDRTEAHALAETLGYLPLALAHAAVKCSANRRITFAGYGRRLTEFWDSHPAAHQEHSGYGQSVYATFNVALDDVIRGWSDGLHVPCPQAETLMGVLAYFAPEEIPASLLASLFCDEGPMMETELDEGLEALALASLLRWGEFDDGTLHVGIHGLVQDVMRGRLHALNKAGQTLSLAIKIIQESFDASGTFEGQRLNLRWLPHGMTILKHAPQHGPIAWHTLWVCHRVGELLFERGDSSRALDMYSNGLAIAERLAASDPGNAGWQRDLSVSHDRIGDVLRAQGNLPNALEAYQASLEIAERLAVSDPGNAGWQRDLSVSHNKVGDVLVEQGNLPNALEAYQASLEIAERLAVSDPGNAGWQRDLSVSHNKVGDVLVEQGNLPNALEAYQASLEIAERLAVSDPGNAGWQRDLSVSHDRIGDVLRAQGNLPNALEAYQASLEIAERLAVSDPGNAGWQRDLSVSHDRIGDVLRAQGNLPNALEAYQASLEIAERLAVSDPGNAGWQRDLSVSHDRIGDVLRAQGNLPNALEAYQASLEIAERLAVSDPGNAGWQRDLSVSHNKVGDVLVEQGNLPNALEAYQASLEIRERLAASDPGNAGWQHDVALSLQRLGLVATQQGERLKAISAYKRGLEIMQRLVDLAPDHAGFRQAHAWFKERLTELRAP